MDMRTVMAGSTLEQALTALRLGYAPVPVQERAKVPAVPWKRWQKELPGEALVRRWFASGRRNLAVVTTGLVVFDCDGPEGEPLVVTHCGATPHRVQTPRGGVHLGYRRPDGAAVTNRVRVNGLALDLRTDGGLEVLPPSRTARGCYAWLGPGLLAREEPPVACLDWIRPQTARWAEPLAGPVACGTAGQRGPCSAVERARAYLATIEGAVSGRRGHDRTFRAACVLAQRFGLAFEEAWPLLLEWNARCEPPWSECELVHKLTDAVARRARPGTTVDDRPEAGTASRSSTCRKDAPSPTPCAAPTARSSLRIARGRPWGLQGSRRRCARPPAVVTTAACWSAVMASTAWALAGGLIEGRCGPCRRLSVPCSCRPFRVSISVSRRAGGCGGGNGADPGPRRGPPCHPRQGPNQRGSIMLERWASQMDVKGGRIVAEVRAEDGRYTVTLWRYRDRDGEAERDNTFEADDLYRFHTLIRTTGLDISLHQGGIKQKHTGGGQAE